MASLLDFAVITIFAREFLEGSIILGEYRTIIFRGGPGLLEAGVSPKDALRAVHMAAYVAIALALLVIAAIAIPLIALSSTFDDKTSKIIEGVSKMVAGVCLLQLSLKLPKFLGVYGSCKKKKEQPKKDTPAHKDTAGEESLSGTFTDNETKGNANDTTITPTTTTSNASAPTPTPTVDEEEAHVGQLSLRNMRFNVAWNIWREGTCRNGPLSSCFLFVQLVFSPNSLHSRRMRGLFNPLFPCWRRFGIDSPFGCRRGHCRESHGMGHLRGQCTV